MFLSTSLDGKLTQHEEVPRISDIDNEGLVSDITPEEVKAAAFSMHTDKSPKKDGMNPAFYQTYWHIVGTDVVAFCQNFIS